MGAPKAPLEGRRATVMGLGLFGGGAAVARHLVRRGARVTVTDLRAEAQLAPALAELRGLPLRFVLGRHEEADFVETELVVANPAVPRASRYLELARAAGVPITSEAALFLDATPARVAAVTGTQGKSSTVSFLAQLLKAAGRRVWLGGNIGESLLDALEEMRAEDLVVLELSSYQLEMLPDELERRGERSPVAVVGIVNVLPDHLERHGTLEAYARAKLRLLELPRPGGAALVARELLARFAAAPPPSGLELREPPGPEDPGPALRAALARAPLAADFQRDNARFAFELARLLGLSEAELLPGLAALRGLPHRLELLGARAGHPVYDNGVSTTPDSTVSAMRALAPGFTLLCGGQPKRLELDELVAVAAGRARRAIVFGAAAASWVPALRAAGLEAEPAAGVEEAARLAFERMAPAEPLLFSPAAASFDAWPNFRARALAFRAALPPEEPAPQAGAARPARFDI